MMRFIAVAIALLAAGSAAAQVQVRGYTRSNGTYVAPHTRSSPNNSTYDNYGSRPSNSYSTPAPLYSAPRPAYAPPAPATTCTGYGCAGQPSTANGQPRNTYVNGYTRSDGTYVQGYYRSGPN